MPRVFDGIATLGASIFGDPVTIYPGGGAPKTVTGILREVPVEGGEDEATGAPVRALATTLKLLPADADGLGRDDTVEQAGQSWQVASSVPGGSPASDGFRLFDLKTPE